MPKEIPKMAGKNTAAFGIYRSVEALQAAVDTLRVEGFRSEDVSVLYPENVGSKDLATVKATKAPEGAATGAGSGAVIGGVLGWAGRHRCPGDSRFGSFYCGRSDCGGTCGRRCGWRTGRDCGGSRRHGYPG